MCMKLFLKKQALSHSDNYEVFDEMESLLYTAKGDVHSREVKLHLYNSAGKEIVYVNEKQSVDKPTYEIAINGSIFAVLSREETWQNRSYSVDSKNGKFTVSQDFDSADYLITFRNSPFGSIKKDTTTWRKGHVLTLNTDDNVEFFVAMLLAMACLEDHQK